ncbi:MAG: hypothetical protein NZM37_07710 [Sandaracinaceae bacterium]|nr:hypothetical protein [Sandaracinaceae bacterium]MDW8245602.1 hypothetical protein [Sandaracinaceae bacterium]
MAELEEHAIQRDRAFLVRLVVALGLGIAIGLWIGSALTSEEIGKSSARLLGYEMPDSGNSSSSRGKP